ncbi:tripartite tricarboxylate transporter TctB family protein [Cognatishimia sp. SS12]|uniref:tripartite tricarboxylate transporter TctB family protein n=1 Tax=Cognatishimia sp. SS12 TaxID=2979465 RepID=UPI00232C6622|nr:tripartite tricarboxylate transporter TctB family protein [Cognatishimia sp. SS12]MDC0738300.1 tripartite tricarboxylate transporter TctB family protein [Cognatishimia sp. SS12]
MPSDGAPQDKIFALSDAQKDLLTALCILVFALGGFFFINSEGASVYPGDGGLTWRTLPFIYSGLLTGLSLIYLTQSFHKMRAEDAGAPKARDAAEERTERIVWVRRIGSLLLLLAFAMTLKVFGFATVVPIFLFLLFRLYQRGRWQTDLMLSIGGGFLLWVLFVPVLKMNLKGGALDVLTPILLKALKAVGL